MREKWVDNVKGFAIYLVILGHSIQYATSENYHFRDNIIFKWIYSFHMPLFMLLSGYLFWYTLNKYSIGKGIVSKVRGILVPCMVWGEITYIIDVAWMDYKPLGLLESLNYAFFSNWFLWSVFYCSLIGFLIKAIFQNKPAGYIVVLLLNYIIPVFFNTTGTKRLLPFFIIGIVVNQYGWFIKLEKNNYKIVLGILGMLHLFSIAVMPEVELVTGLLGSLFICILFRNINFSYIDKIFGMFGKVSIGIYVFSGIIFWFCIKYYFRITEEYRYILRCAYIFGLSIIILIISWVVCMILSKNKYTRVLLLGKKE